MRCLLCFFLQNRCSGRGCLNYICITSYGVGAKFFTTNLMSVDLSQNTPKTRKPIAERTSHRWYGYTTRGCSSLCCTKQLLLLPRNARNAQNLLAEKGLPRMARIDTDGWGALFSHRWYGWTQNLAAWVWQGCHTLLICEHLCSSVGGSSLPEGSVCAFCGNIFSPTDGTDGHRWLWCAVLPQNSQNTQNLAAWVCSRDAIPS